jgi:hypothetical protein
MAPVRVRLYGMFSRTKRQYVSQQIVAALMLILLAGVWIYWRTQIVPDLAGRNLPRHIAVLLSAFDAIPWLVVPLAVAVGLETLLVMRIFARKEADQRAAEAKETKEPAETETQGVEDMPK